ncbi:MAG: hypothetical protein M2R45_00625 [Verrucomicrobia subdivision 3 bacterium]|nr:hypothetical protein [Limisphaerales bacterium]MCS1414492.1 hypothetical protein [Limisphaerales bacterium]
MNKSVLKFVLLLAFSLSAGYPSLSSLTPGGIENH